ncbi:MAG TPA: DUF2513 domain-containing protein [Clostridia bacterium]
MVRNMDLIRLILLEIEKSESIIKPIDLCIEEYSNDEITYQIMLLHEAGLIEAVNLSHLTAVCWKPQRLTWEGHEYLNIIRDDMIWNRTKKEIVDNGLPMDTEIIKQISSSLVRETVYKVIKSIRHY